MARHRGQPPGTYRVTSHKSGDKGAGRTYVIRLPAEIGETIPDGVLFKPELTDEGIMFRVFNPEDAKPVLPSWAKRS